MNTKNQLVSPSSEKPTEVDQKSKRVFPIVGIGASAGGLEAFEDFFRHCDPDIGLAFVLVPHLDPSHVSMLTEILQRSTKMPVIEAQDQTKVEANRVYIIPPNREMAIIHGKLQLSVPTVSHGQRMPIDGFLRSLAEDQNENAIGIILSGTGSDGTLGLRAVYGAGGNCFVQEPATAKYDGMPTSAIKAGYVTKVLPVANMPEALQAGANSFNILSEINTETKKTHGVSHILMQLRTITGHDFSLYKQSTVIRRIERRMLKHDITDIEIYARYLKEFPAEAHILFKELLINVTSFFRDTEAFLVLENDVLPQLCLNKSDEDNFRVWVPGCASGEEAYSIAILLSELMDKTQQNFKVQIYASDLDDDAIATARAGLYPINISQDLTPERLRRFFTKEITGYKVKKEIRDMVVFAIQNVIKDPPFTKLDLLSCRNLMIYLGAELQNRLMPTFHYALKPNGVLMVSPSEGIGSFTSLFSPISRKWKIYRAIHNLSSPTSRFNIPTKVPTTNDSKTPEKAIKQPMENSLAEISRRLLMQYFAPASVFTDLKGNILYVHGDTGKYLRPAQGQASLNVIEMAREGMEIQLRAAIHSASIENKPTLNHEMQVKTNGGFTTVSLSVRQVNYGSADKQAFLLVSFQDVVTPSNQTKRKVSSKPEELKRLEELENDLLYLKENHQVLIEEQQATNEELKSANEELQSTNEEMQSSNEELETSKEELQSINEELITVNSELQTKMDQLSEMQSDMKNLLESTDIGIVFLDEHLMIRSFTREAVRIYRLVPSDIGRPLSDIRSISDQADNLIEAAKNVLDSLIPFETELHVLNNWILVRIQPYRTTDNFINGVVLTFTDITARIKSATTQEALDLAEGIVNTVREPLIVLDAKMNVISINTAFETSFQVSREDAIGRKIYQLGNFQWDIPALRKLLEELLITSDSIDDYVVHHDFPGIGHKTIRIKARRLVTKMIETQLILLSFEIN
ncbi:chemotaxis protein CheB [Methylotenera versatilis]|uniref:chemotaxis protein CheB n=1 Tax=Methylotenera versatilis TaxID=1055487 RepID=UPI0011D0E386|nr:chemotaxis protein CheB [Methylotenera versatilis]